MKKKKELVQNEKWYQKIPWARVIIGSLIGSAVGLLALFFVNKNTYLQKNVVNQYICKIVGSAPEENVIAFECLSK